MVVIIVPIRQMRKLSQGCQLHEQVPHGDKAELTWEHGFDLKAPVLSTIFTDV